MDQLVEEVYSVSSHENDYADSKEWMEFQDKVAELPIDLSKAEFNHKQWTLENEVKDTIQRLKSTTLIILLS